MRKLKRLLSFFLFMNLVIATSITGEVVRAEQNDIYQAECAITKTEKINIDDSDLDCVNDLVINKKTLNADADFINDCCNDYGFRQLANEQNGATKQSLYITLRNAYIQFWNNTSDINYTTVSGTKIYILSYVTTTLTSNEAFRIMNYLQYDNPILYYIGDTLYYNRNKIYIVIPDEFAEHTVRQSTQSYLENFIKLFSLQDSIYSTALYIHNYICEHVVYGRDSSGNIINNAYVHSMAGLQNGQVVCDGYSYTFHCIMNYLDLESLFVAGFAQSSSESPRSDKGHAWNMAKMDDGNWYSLDITWDDSYSTSKYFLVGNSFYDSHLSIYEYSFGSGNTYYCYYLPTMPATNYTHTVNNITLVSDPVYSIGSSTSTTQVVTTTQSSTESSTTQATTPTTQNTTPSTTQVTTTQPIPTTQQPVVTTQSTPVVIPTTQVIVTTQNTPVITPTTESYLGKTQIINLPENTTKAPATTQKAAATTQKAAATTQTIKVSNVKKVYIKKTKKYVTIKYNKVNYVKYYQVKFTYKNKNYKLKTTKKSITLPIKIKNLRIRTARLYKGKYYCSSWGKIKI